MCVIASQSILFSIFSLSPHIVITTLGYSQKFFGIFFGVNALTYTIASIISARLLTKVSGKTCIMIGSSLMITGGILLFTITTYSEITIITLIIPTLLASSGTSFILGPATSMAIEPYRRITGTATALIGSAEAISAAFIGNLAVKLSSFEGSTLSCIILISGITAMVFILLFNPRKKHY
jgi:MFS family permease